ncbi:MAG TPA: prepilin-type N-terminal cleavage/methylation domain-containing protein [Kofleriaceae bacterium]|nr:prepilin-type N-terminal cleavage/methylation domain-containing protein [Kofleriaceae bacterium]
MTRSRHLRRELGFTLVEVMISLVISTVLVGMVLAIWSRMSIAYRGQQGVAELQQILSAGHEMIEADLREAGFQIADGFFIAGDYQLHQPVEIVDNASGFGPDELRVYAADAAGMARVQDFNGVGDLVTSSFTSLTVDTAADFAPGDLAVIVKTQDGLPTEVGFFACVVQIAAINGNLMTLSSSAPWGSTSNDQCDQVRTGLGLGDDTRAIVYRFRARAYRIDSTRRDLAVLQLSATAGRVNDWQDLAIGFTDLQIASRWDDREWWSGAAQTTMTAPLTGTTAIPPAPFELGSYNSARSRLVAVRVTLVVRTHTRIDVVPSQRTPALIDGARPDNNDLGNRAAVQLEGVADLSRPQELRGEHIYRHATVGTDLRNMGVGL